MASEIQILNEIAHKLNLLKCICSNTSQESRLVIHDYQVLDCSGNPVGEPLSVLPVITVSKQDVNLCNVDSLATAIGEAVAIGGDEYNIVAARFVGPDASQPTFFTTNVIDMNKLHSFYFSIIGTTGTVEISAGTGSMSDIDLPPSLPVGFSTGFTASTVFGTGDLSIITTGDATIIFSLISKA